MAEEPDADLVMQSLLLDEIGQSVIGMDEDWRVTYWNRASERLYGFSASQVIGAEVARLGMLARGTCEAAIREIQERIANGGTWSGELWIHHPAGGNFLSMPPSVLSTVGTPVRWPWWPFRRTSRTASTTRLFWLSALLFLVVAFAGEAPAVARMLSPAAAPGGQGQHGLLS